MLVKTSVVSSSIRSVGYDKDTEILQVDFKDGSVYQYEGVPPDIYQGFISSPSKGHYFIANVRESFSFNRIS